MPQRDGARHWKGVCYPRERSVRSRTEFPACGEKRGGRPAVIAAPDSEAGERARRDLPDRLKETAVQAEELMKTAWAAPHVNDTHCS
jgi:hypothetical protein